MLRNAAIMLLAAALAMAAPPADPEIPQKAIAQESRTRAAFTPAERARAGALEAQLSSKMSIKEVNALVAHESTGVAFAVLVAYLRILEGEARQDRKMAGADAERSQAAKESKLDREKTKIGDMKLEAAERFDHAMSAANIGMAIGIASCAAAAASAVASVPAGAGGSGAGAKLAPPVAVRATVPNPTRTPTSKSSGSKSQKG